MIEIKKIYQPIFARDFSTILYYGGRGSGKSWGVTDSLILRSRDEKIKVVTCRETKQSMEKSVVALYRERIEFFEYKDFVIQKDYIKNTNSGAEFYFIGLNDSQEAFIQGIKSIPNIDILVIEEAQSISNYALDIVIPTIRRNAKGSLLIAIWNPQSKQDPIWDLVANPRPRTYIQKVNYLENTFCPAETVEEAELCKIHKPDDYNHIWLGEPKDLAVNAVTKHFTSDNIRNLNYCDDIDLWLTCDFNTSAPMCWEIAHKDDNKIYFIDEIAIENVDTRETCEEFLRRYGNHKGVIVITGDASGDRWQAGNKQSNYAVIEKMLDNAGLKYKLKLRPGNPEIVNRVEAWNNRILTMYGERSLFISPKCKWLLYNVYNLKWKEGIQDKIDLPSPAQIRNNRELNFLGHPFDAASYLVELEFPFVKHKLEKFVQRSNFSEKSLINNSAWEALGSYYEK